MLNYNKLKNVLETQKITLKFVAEQIGMTSHGLSAAFKNNSLKVRDLQNIAQVLNVSVSVFFDDSNNGDINVGVGNLSDTTVISNTGSNFNINTANNKDEKEKLDAEKKELRKSNLLYWSILESLVNNQAGLLKKIVIEAPQLQPFIAKQSETRSFMAQLNTLLKLTDNMVLYDESFFDYFENPYQI